jgi:putative endonuclease
MLPQARRLRRHARQRTLFPFGGLMRKTPCVYILASRRNGTLYIGVTSHLAGRVNPHVQELVPGFTARHHIHSLVYYEMHPTMEAAIKCEKQLKKWNRNWKARLIEQANPEWINLFDRETGEIAELPADRARRKS